MVFEKILEAITNSDFEDDIKDVQIDVSTAISSMFDTWKYDINALRDRMVHDASFYAIKESKSLDVGSEKKKKARGSVRLLRKCARPLCCARCSPLSPHAVERRPLGGPLCGALGSGL
jgi:hypothetical protein